MEDSTYIRDSSPAFNQLLKVLGHNGKSAKIRKTNSASDEVDLRQILEDSFGRDGESDDEDPEESPSCEGIRTDGINTFNMGYEEYLEETNSIATDYSTTWNCFKVQKLKSLTPVMRELLKASALPDLTSTGNPYGIEEQLLKKLSKLMRKGGASSSILKRRKRLRHLFNCLNSYVDVFYSGCRIGDLHSVRFLYALHASNHVSKSVNSAVEKSHGYTRPRVLYVCGLKSCAQDFIQHMVNLLSVKKDDPKYEKFLEEYDLPEEDEEQQQASFQKTNKSFDFIETFSGNQDDAFKMGMRYQGGRLHLYTPFYTSDVIVASPLGLNIMLQEEEYDFLSSIEVLLMDRLDVIKFQNWRFLHDLINKVNLPLQKWRDADLNRLRVSTLDGYVKQYRQTVAVSCTQHSVFNALFRSFENRRGSMKLCCVTANDFVLLGSQLKVQQLFIKVASSTVKDCEDDLMKYFVKNMISSLHGIGGVLIVLGDYTHYLRMNKEFQNANMEYLPCHESCTPKQMLFARQQFQAGNTPALVTTARMLFFKRYVIKGTCRVFFVLPPEYPDIYREVFKMFDLSKKNSMVTLYTKFHGLQLEAIVGQTKLQKLMGASDTNVTQFH